MRPSSPNAESRKTHPGRVALLIATFAVFGLAVSRGFVRCPSAAFLHRPCPACGSTRSVMSLLKGDLIEALRTNPVAPFATACALVLLVFYAQAVYRDGSGKGAMDTARARFVANLLVFAVVLEFVVWVFRWFGMLGGAVEVNG